MKKSTRKSTRKSTPVKLSIKQTREFLKSLRQLHYDGKLDFQKSSCKFRRFFDSAGLKISCVKYFFKDAYQKKTNQNKVKNSIIIAI